MAESETPVQGSSASDDPFVEIRRLAHDLNNALMPIRLGIDVLRRKVPDPAIERTLSNMERGSGAAAKLVDEILSIARAHGPGS